MKASQAHRYGTFDEYNRIMEELGRAQDQVTALEQMQIEANAIPGPRGREVMVPSPNGQPYGTGTSDNTFLPNPGPSTIQKTDPDMTAEKLLDLAQKMKEEEVGVDHGWVAELRPPEEDPIDRLREEYDFPEEWLEGLESEEPPSPERLRSLAEGIAKREVNDEIELPAKAFARVLLLMARQIEMMMEWSAFRGDRHFTQRFNAALSVGTLLWGN